MTDFFAPPPPREPEPEYRQPEWLGPPENELGVPVALRVVLARTEQVAVALIDVVAFTSGLEFAMEVRLRQLDELSDPFGMRLRQSRRSMSELPDDVLRFGFELSDGRRVTNLADFPGFEDRPAGPVLMQRGGGGGNRSWSFRYWLWPLPPSGSLTVVTEWPAQGVELTRIELDVDPLLEAAARSEVLWPEGGASAGGGFVSTQRIG